MNSFWLYFFGTFHSPRSTFTRLLSDPRQISHGMKSVLLMGILYTITTIGYAVVGAIPLMPPFIGIPAQNYYFWEIFFQIPVFVLGWLLTSGIARGGIWQAFTYSYPLVSLIWLFFLVAMALKIVEKLRWWQVIINSVVTVIYLQALMTIFIR